MNRVAAIVAFLASLIVVGTSLAAALGTRWFFVALAFSVIPLLGAVTIGLLLPAGIVQSRTKTKWMTVPTILVVGLFVFILIRTSEHFDASGKSHFGAIHVLAVFVWVFVAGIGWWIMRAYGRTYYRRCPYCLSTIFRQARKCRHCHEWVLPVPPSPE